MDDDLFIIDRIDDFRSICISPLARETADEGGASNLGGHRGYFIYEVDNRPLIGGVHVLAKAVSFEAALRLAEVWRGKPVNPDTRRRRPVAA